MKKIIFSVSMLAAVTGLNAQSFEIGLNGSINNTWLLNKNVSDQNDELNPSFTIAGSFGLATTYYFNDKVGIGLEINSSAYNQKYSGDNNIFIGDSISFESETHLRYIELPLLLRLKSEGGFYFELGPQLSFLGSALETTSTSPATGFDYTDTRVKTGFNSSLFSGVFGFGGRFDASDNVIITAGLRFSASFNDATKEYTSAELDALYSNPSVASYFGPIGISDAYAHLKQNGSLGYKSTTAVRGGIQISVVYKIPLAK